MKARRLPIGGGTSGGGGGGGGSAAASASSKGGAGEQEGGSSKTGAASASAAAKQLKAPPHQASTSSSASGSSSTQRGGEAAPPPKATGAGTGAASNKKAPSSEPQHNNTRMNNSAAPSPGSGGPAAAAGSSSGGSRLGRSLPLMSKPVTSSSAAGAASHQSGATAAAGASSPEGVNNKAAKKDPSVKAATLSSSSGRKKLSAATPADPDVAAGGTETEVVRKKKKKIKIKSGSSCGSSGKNSAAVAGTAGVGSPEGASAKKKSSHSALKKAHGSSSNGTAGGTTKAAAASKSPDAAAVGKKLIGKKKKKGGGDLANDPHQKTNKKRLSDSSQGMSARTKCYEVLPSLEAVGADGNHATVKIIIGGHHYAPVRDTGDLNNVIHDSTAVGQDGNQFYCQVCRGFGSIVCCDGCPRVYHPTCIPADNPSRLSLEADVDPWYCPECVKERSAGGGGGGKKKGKKLKKDRKKKKKGAASGSAPSRSRTATQHRCVDCQMNRTDLALEVCEACGNYVHHPNCRDDTAPSSSVFCSTCRAVDQLTMEEEEDYQRGGSSSSGKRKRSAAAEDHEDEGDDDDEDEAMASPGAEGDAGTPRPKKRKRKGSIDSGANGSEKKQKKKRLSKKQKKSRAGGEASSPAGSAAGIASKSPSPVPPAASPGPEQRTQPGQPDADFLSPFQLRNAQGLAQAIPAFYFYLGENRWKIERSLARNHRYFNRLPKGGERNQLVAKEAGIWWAKLRAVDQRRYINMSMRDFESRIIEWKEEKNLKELGLAPTPAEASVPTAEDAAVDDSAEDDRLTYERHERLYLNTSVGSKPFKPEADQSYNRVLLDLLHDMRFHPLPMFSVNRSETETVIDDHNAKVTIPHFEVHGPISTSVGDECLGCSRGWIHYCPVLQRRIPAIEHRAKLQPPLSSWVGTRVGLGLRPRLEKTGENDDSDDDDRFVPKKPPGLFDWRNSGETKEVKSLPVLPSSTLSLPSERADDIANFIEETMAMKVPEPARPAPPAVKPEPSTVSAGRKLPVTQRPKEDDPQDEQLQDEMLVYKCGRCRTIIYNDTGCVQCRRAQLVINTTKRAPSNPEKSGSLKVRTVMLGRVQMKDGQTESQTESDLAVGNAILKERWTPSAILPPPGSSVPGGKSLGNDSEDEVSDSMEVEEEGSSEAEDGGAGEAVVGDETGQDEAEQIRRSQRSSRQAAGTSSTGEVPSLDRDHIAKENKKKSDELHRKALSIACCGILLAMKRRDPLLLFAEPASAEGYSAVVKHPIDLGKIRENVLAEKYSSLGAFVSDGRLLCENAVAFNPAGSIYAKTAKELYDLLSTMQKRANNWMGAIMDTYSSFLFNEEQRNRKLAIEGQAVDESSGDTPDPFESLRTKWPQAVDMLENGDWLRNQIEADFMRTQENETAYYGSVAVRRVAAAAEASLAPYTDSGGVHSVVSRRSDAEDESLRQIIDGKVSDLTRPLQLKDVSTWREESVVRLLRKVQSRRLDRRSASENGCSRCDSVESIRNNTKASNVDFAHPGRAKRKGEGDLPRVDPSRVYLTTGLGSAKTCKKIVQRNSQSQEQAMDSLDEVCVSLRGSKVHGWGMFADQPFKKGDVVAEYVGEYVSNSVADAREKNYQQQRIQDYQFRLDDKLVIDATMKGGYGRYINHNCSPNCYAKIVPGKEPNPHLKRVLIIAQRNIEINEEISYDYQFPLELNLDNRVPCNCQSDGCRGFMNWDIPEKGSNNRALLVQKRGANMRDRIRRLGRPLKREEA